MPDPINDLIPHFDPVDPRSVVERARRRRRTTLGTVAVVITVALAVILVPTVAVPSLAGRTARPAEVTMATPSTLPSVASTPPRSATSGPVGACGLTALPAAWKAALKPAALTPASNVAMLARDATTGRALYGRFASPTAGPSPTTVSVVEASGAERKLFDLSADEQAFAGAIEGDWAAVTVGSIDGFTVTGVYARRVTGGDLVTVAVRAADFSSGPITGTPVLYRGVVYLQTGSSILATPTASLVAVDLEGRQVRRQEVPRQGSPTMVRWGDALVWTSSTKAPVMASLSTLGVVEVPSRLASLADAWWFSSDGQTIAWEGNGATGGWLRAADVGAVAAREISFSTPITNPGMTSWGRYATLLVADREWIVDLETGQYAPLTIAWGTAVVAGGRLATSEMATQKGGSAGLYELDLTKVAPLPACTR